MKVKCLLFWALFLYSSGMLAHGGHQATFKYQRSGSQLLLEFRLEKSILDHFDFTKTCENFQTATAMCLVNYIRENSSFQLNGEPLVFELQAARKDRQFMILEMAASVELSENDHIQIYNECFVELDHHFENRIIFQYEQDEKSYRLNHKHKSLSLTY